MLSSHRFLWSAGAIALAALAGGGCVEQPIPVAPAASAAPAPSASAIATAPAPKLAPRLTSFVPPGRVDDFPAGKEKQRAEFFAMWSNNINQWTEQAILGDPWTVENDRDRLLYYNPLGTDVPADAKTIVVSWFPFPNRLRKYFGERFSAEEIYELADNGQLADGRKIPDLPAEVCPQINPDPAKTKPFFPAGSRGWMDEYVEWSVTRDPRTKKIVSVMFTSENPDYWRALWNVDPDLVADLYRGLLHRPSVQKEDLYLRLDGKVVIDPVTGRPAYDMLNKWNRGSETLAGGGGAVHLTSAPNTLRAEIYLAAAATLLRTDDKTPQDLTCASQFGQNFRNSDPHIGFAANQLVKNLNTKISLADPVGLYIQDPDFSRFKLPKQAPRGASPRDYWRVVRGRAGGSTLHAVLEVPPNLGFTVGDMLIDDKPIRWAAQVTETFKIGLSVTAFPSDRPPQAQQPKVKDSAAPLAQPILIAGFQALKAAPTVDRDTPWFAPTMRRGQTLRGLGLAVRAAKDKPTIAFTGEGVSATVTGSTQINSPTDGVVTIFELDVTVAANAPPGKRDVTVNNPGQANGPAGRGFLEIAP
jgi:hypothetical protein